MAQLNIHLQPAFVEDLEKFMSLRGVRTKSEAVRIAVREGLDRLIRKRRSHPDFQQWKGRALRAAVNPRPRFQSDEDLWG
ncbi:MAG: hypothetical protein GY856_34430 [bacterium]|nr:hypothetical protein [bacterium]